MVGPLRSRRRIHVGKCSREALSRRMLHEFESCTEMVRAVVLSCSTGIVAWAEIGTNRCAEASSVGYVEGHSNMRGQAMSSSTPTRSVVERPRTGAPVWRRTRPMCRMHEGNPSRLTRIRKHRRSARRVSTVWNPTIRSGSLLRSDCRPRSRSKVHLRCRS